MWGILKSLAITVGVALGLVVAPAPAPAPAPQPEPMVIQRESSDDLRKIEELQAVIEGLRKEIRAIDPNALLVGTINAVQAQKFRLSGSGVTSSATSLGLTSFQLTSGTNITMAHIGTKGYGTLEPGTQREEQVSFTGVTQNSDGSATLTGVSRGLEPVTPFSASTTFQKSHAGGSVFILTNTAAFYNEFANKSNLASVTALWDFSSTTPPRYDLVPANHLTGAVVATNSEFASMAALNAVVAAGCSDAAEGNQGCVELATAREAASSTENGSEAKLVLQSKYATDTPQNCASNPCPVLTKYGRNTIDQSFLKLDEAFTFSGTLTSSATTTLQKTRVGTTSHNTEIGLVVATTTQFAKGVGIGVGTTTNDPNLQVTGSAIFNTATASVAYFDQCFGCFTYTGSSTVYNVSSGGNVTFTGSVPAIAKYGVIDVTQSTNVAQTKQVILFRSGLTTLTVSNDYTTTGPAYSTRSCALTISGNNFTVAATSDACTGTAYWYR